MRYVSTLIAVAASAALGANSAVSSAFPSYEDVDGGLMCNNEPVLYCADQPIVSVKDSAVTFYVPVYAPYFMRAPAVLRETHFEVGDADTYIVNAHGDTIKAQVPYAIWHPGRQFTFKMIGEGFLVLDVTNNPAAPNSERIDGEWSYFLEGTQSGEWKSITIEALPGSGWYVVSH